MEIGDEIQSVAEIPLDQVEAKFEDGETLFDVGKLACDCGLSGLKRSSRIAPAWWASRSLLRLSSGDLFTSARSGTMSPNAGLDLDARILVRGHASKDPTSSTLG